MVFLVPKTVRVVFCFVLFCFKSQHDKKILCDLPDISSMDQIISCLQMGLEWAMGKMLPPVFILSPTNSIYLLELLNIHLMTACMNKLIKSLLKTSGIVIKVRF